MSSQKSGKTLFHPLLISVFVLLRFAGLAYGLTPIHSIDQLTNSEIDLWITK